MKTKKVLGMSFGYMAFHQRHAQQHTGISRPFVSFWTAVLREPVIEGHIPRKSQNKRKKTLEQHINPFYTNKTFGCFWFGSDNAVQLSYDSNNIIKTTRIFRFL